MIPPETTQDKEKPATLGKRAGFEMFWYCLKLLNGARDRNRTGMPVIHEAADFKSDVSTYFTTRARLYCETKKASLFEFTRPIRIELSIGGATQSRTGLHGFAKALAKL